MRLNMCVCGGVELGCMLSWFGKRWCVSRRVGDEVSAKWLVFRCLSGKEAALIAR